MKPPLFSSLSSVIVLALATGACAGSSGISSPTPTTPAGQTPEHAIAEAEEAFRLEGILTGEVVDADAKLMTLAQADRELTEWGAVLASYAEYPSPDTPVWLVYLLGYAREPRPGGGSLEECTEMRAVVTIDPFEDFNLMGRPSDKC